MAGNETRIEHPTPNAGIRNGLWISQMGPLEKSKGASRAKWGQHRQAGASAAVVSLASGSDASTAEIREGH